MKQLCCKVNTSWGAAEKEKKWTWIKIFCFHKRQAFVVLSWCQAFYVEHLCISFPNFFWTEKPHVFQQHQNKKLHY